MICHIPRFLGIFVPCTLPFILARRYSFVSVNPILIFVPFEGSSSSCLCCIEGFFLELLSRMPTLSWGVQWRTCLSGLHRASSVLQFLPLLHRGLLLGTSCAHAHFISGRPVEYLSVWSSVMRLSSCGSCLFAIQRASSWSLFCACPLYLGASSGVPICLASVV